MHSFSHQQRLLTARAQCAALACCAWMLTAANTAADTCRSAVYKLDVPGVNAPGASRKSVERSVYMRVTGSAHTTGDASSQLEFSARKDTSGFALFEFFAADKAASLSIEQIRFRDRHLARPGLGALRGVYGVDRAQISNNRSSLRPGSADFTMTIDLSGVADRRGLGSENRVAVLFALTRGVTIDSLIDQYLTQGILRPEVRFRLPSGERQWLILKVPTCIRPGDRDGDSHFQLAGTSAVPAPTAPVPVSIATGARRLYLLSDGLWRAFIQHNKYGVISAPRQVRPRAPPQTAV